MIKRFILVSVLILSGIVWTYGVGAESLLEQKKTKFSALIGKQKNDRDREELAIRVARNKKSQYRNIAIDYLIATDSRRFIAVALTQLEDPRVNRGVLLYLRKRPSRHAIEPLIALLKTTVGSLDSSLQDDVIFTLRVITGEGFPNLSNRAKDDQEKMISSIEEWWTKNQATFKIVEKTEEQRKKDMERWRRYGLNALQ